MRLIARLMIGAGAVLTTAFLKDGRSFIHRTSQPLLASPSQVVQTLHWYDVLEEGYQLTLGPWSFAPPPPTWREFFVSEDIQRRTDKEIEKICCSHLIEPVDFDKPMSARYPFGANCRLRASRGSLVLGRGRVGCSVK